MGAALGTFIGLTPWILLATGVAAFVGGLRCFADRERAGVFAHPVAGIIAATFLLGMGVPIGLWFASNPDRMGGQGVLTLGSFGNVLIGLMVTVGLFVLFAPLLAYHLGRALGRSFATESTPPPDPEDPFERAKAAEERGDSQAAVERYEWLLKREPAHFEARTRLADLLARTGKLHRSRHVLDDGLGLPDVDDRMRSEWRRLKGRIADGSFGVATPEGDSPSLKALGDVKHARLEAFREDPVAGGGDDGPLDASSLDENGKGTR